jgi:hypothetical protein
MSEELCRATESFNFENRLLCCLLFIEFTIFTEIVLWSHPRKLLSEIYQQRPSTKSLMLFSKTFVTHYYSFLTIISLLLSKSSAWNPSTLLKKMGMLGSKPVPSPAEDAWKIEGQALRDKYIDPHHLTEPMFKAIVEVAKEYGEGFSPYGGLLPGLHKYLGGATDPRDGCIYGIPSHSKSLICLYPENGVYKVRFEPLPEHAATGKFKWLRGIIAHGYLYGIPAWANSVLEVDIDAMWGKRKAKGNIINLIPLPDGHISSQWQWHGASLNNEKTAIYAIPSNAQKVLKVDLKTHTTSFIDIEVPEKFTNFNIEHTNKWYGGILGDDNAVYGMPYRTCSLLRIDTSTDTASLVGPDHGCQLYNWHGGLKRNGMIYAFPSHADTVLKIDTTEASKGQNCTLLEIHRAAYDNDLAKNYKWLGGSIGEDGHIYAMPADASTVLKINVTTDHCSTFGFVGKEKNKWQGGVLASDGCVYAIPANGRHVLRIDTRSKIGEGENPLQLLGNLPDRKDKWQGAFIGTDGNMWAIPECGYRILRVSPSVERPENDDVPKDIKVELM